CLAAYTRLPCKSQVVKLPELFVLAGAPGRNRHVTGKFMNLVRKLWIAGRVQGIVLIYDQNAIAKVLMQSLQSRGKTRTCRTLKISKLRQYHRGLIATFAKIFPKPRIG